MCAYFLKLQKKPSKIFLAFYKPIERSLDKLDDWYKKRLDWAVRHRKSVFVAKRFDIPTDWLRMPSTCHHNAPELMQLVDQFLNEITRQPFPKLFYLWGHTYEFEGNNNWEVIEKFCEAIGNRDDVWYANNMQVYEYVEAYRALTFSADGRMVYNPSAQTIWFLSDNETVKVAPGETVKIK